MSPLKDVPGERTGSRRTSLPAPALIVSGGAPAPGVTTSFWSPSAREIAPNGQLALDPAAPQELTAGGTAIGGAGAWRGARAAASCPLAPSPVPVPRLPSSAAAVYATGPGAAVRSCALEMV